MNVRPARLALFGSIGLLLGSAYAACDPAAYGQTLELEALGTIYVGELSFDGASDSADLSGGLCFSTEAEPALTLTAPAMRVTALQTNPTFSAEGANLTFGRYTIFAAELSGDARGLSLQNLDIASPQFSGTVTRARYTLRTAQTILSGVRLQIGSFRVESVAAGLTENTLVLQDARASTCSCEGDGLYTLRAPSVIIDLQSGIVRLTDGTLEVLGLQVALNDALRLQLDTTQAALQRGVNVASAPVLGAGLAPAPVGAVIDEGSKIALPLRLFPWALFEIGVAGLDADHALGAVSLLKLTTRLGRTGFFAALGRAGPGWRADALIRHPLWSGINLDLSTTNRLWERAGYLSDGTLSLAAGRTYRRVLSDVADSLALNGQLFAGLSSQTVAGLPVRSLRLGSKAGATYTSAPTPVGTFSLLSEASYTYYPRGTASDDDLTQVGLRLSPSWRNQWGPLRATLGYDSRLVLGASPFSVEFDRLEPMSLLDASASWTAGPFSVGVRGRYAFVLNSWVNPVRALRLDASRVIYLGKLKNSYLFSAEFAGLLGPEDPDTDAFASAETSVDLAALGVDVQLGFKVRYDLLPRTQGLELLELYGAFPIEFPALTLKPFLGFNMASLVTGEPLPTLTGYGLEVAYRSCCGTLRASYRFHDETAVATFDLRLAPEVPGPKP